MPGPLILLLDDDRDTRELYTMVLGFAHYRVATAGTIGEAVRLAHDVRPDAIVTDWRLPDGDGFTFFGALNRHARTRRIPKIAATGMSLRPGEIAHARAQGCEQVLTKPIDPDLLVQAIDAAIARQVTRRLQAAARRMWRNAQRIPSLGADSEEVTASRLIDSGGQSMTGLALILANDQGRYVAVNDDAAELTGYPAQELTALTVWDLTPLPKNALGQELWQQFIAAGTQEGRYTVRRRSGESVEAAYVAVANLAPGLHLSVLTST